MRTALFAVLSLAGAAGLVFAADDATTLKVKEGDKAPDVQLPATQIDKFLPDKKDAKTISLKDFEGKKNVVLYFYPKAMTPGCTKESCAFRDRLAGFSDLDTVVIGVSTDNVADQQKFTEKEKLTFPLFADNDQKLATALGVMKAGAKVTRRETFVIDKKGVIRKIYTDVKPEPHPEEVLQWVKENLAK
jgi:peroxiredoxin Q/BCP